VLIDVMMPVMDGYEAARRMRESDPDQWVPIIFLSSKEGDQDLDRAIEAGGDDYLVKPVSFVVLNAKIRALHRMETMRRKLSEVSLELTLANHELEKLSHQDGLTSIANRRSFDACLLQELRRAVRDRTPLSLILADVDHFKAYNDCYGHHAGDDCLRRVAGAFKAAARRPADFPARYGGEEFAMVLPGTPLEGALAVAGMVAQEISQLEIAHTRSETAAVITVSQGLISLLPTPETLPGDLIERADQALYQAKSQGRNRFVSAGAAR
jgi:diguanylate cyclase (GGDEF)-like protein